MWRKPSDGTVSSDSASSPTPISSRPQQTSDLQPKQAVSERSVSTGQAGKPSTFSSPLPTSKIGAGLKIRGEISGDSDLYLDGEISGKIRLKGARVTVGPNGRVQADIEAREISVEGAVQGNLKADQRLRLGASSRVEGALAAPSIGMDDGARFRGKAEVTRTQTAAPAPQPEASEAAETVAVTAHAESE